MVNSTVGVFVAALVGAGGVTAVASASPPQTQDFAAQAASIIAVTGGSRIFSTVPGAENTVSALGGPGGEGAFRSVTKSGPRVTTTFGRTSTSALTMTTSTGVKVTLGTPGAASRLVLEPKGLVTSDTSASLSGAVQATEGGGRSLAVLRDRPSGSSVSYPLSISRGLSLVPSSTGSLEIRSSKGVTVGYVAKPWALDATGRQLSTSYQVKAGALIQRIDTTQARFPVVADPWITLGWHIYLHLTPTDQRALLIGSVATYAAIGALVCAELGPGAVVCAVGAAALGAIIASYVSDLYNPNRTLVLEFTYLGVEAGSYYE
jgi:hypothetical protein